MIATPDHRTSAAEPAPSLGNAEVLATLRRWAGKRPALSILSLGDDADSRWRRRGALPWPHYRWATVPRDRLVGAPRRIVGRIGPGGDALRWQAHPVDISRSIAALPLAGVNLVILSGLFDLVSRSWLEALIARLIASRTALLASAPDGALAWRPADRDDGVILQALNAHARADSGLGPALGPVAGGYLAGRLAGLGFTIVSGQGDVRLGAEATLEQLALLERHAAMAAPYLPSGERARLEGWLRRRRALAEDGVSSVTIGGIDCFALPPRR